MFENLIIDSISYKDWPLIMDLQIDSYETIEPETLEVLKSKYEMSKNTCFTAKYGDMLKGYILALPYEKFKMPSMVKPETKVFLSKNLHIHDAAVKKSSRNKGFSKKMLNRLITRAKELGYEEFSLVALKHAVGFWSKNGFKKIDDINVPGYYGEGAVYMNTEISQVGRALKALV